MDELIRVSIKIGIDEKWSKNHTYAYNGGFITYKHKDILYVVKESTAITKLLEYNGYTKNEDAFAHMINEEDYNRYVDKEGIDGENAKKLDAFLHDKDFLKKWNSITDIKDLEEFLMELTEHSPYFRTIKK